MEEIRCKKCRRLLMKVTGDFARISVYIKCPKCHSYQHFGSVSETEEGKAVGKKEKGDQSLF